MRRLLIALALAFGGESAALACSCIAVPADEAQLRTLADEIAVGAAALVEVDVRSAYDVRTRRGERVRVLRTFAGRAPREFRLAREGRQPSSAMCDIEYPAGSRAMMLVYPAERSRRRRQAELRDAGLCVGMLLHNANFRQFLMEAMRRPRPAARVSAAASRRPCQRRA